MVQETPGSEGTPEQRGGIFRLLASSGRSYWIDTAKMLAPWLIASAALIFIALHFLRPGPASTLTIASGPAGTKFNLVAQQYQKIMARNGIRLRIVVTEGSLDNLNRLLDRRSGVDIALVQSGIPHPADTDDLISLGSVFYIPLTIFYRNATPIERLSQLRGHRIAIGPTGSGTRSLAEALLKENEIEAGGPTQFLELDGEPARKALLAQQVDAIFLTGDSASTQTIIEMLHQPGIRLFDFPQADGYVRRFRYLNKLEIPPGTFDLGENLPSEQLNLLAPTVELLAHSDLHPALSDLLLETAMQVHGNATLLQTAGQFPNPATNDFPVSADAARFYKSGKSFAYRYLPFWLASLLDRVVVVFLPVVLVVIPIFRYLPALYNWRIKRRIHYHYGQLMALERQSVGTLSPQQRTQILEQLTRIEKSVIALKIPGSHADELYILREHMQFVRENLSRDESQTHAVADKA
jgi:TRAP-type uncharacterized transport system substrate-binding protein